MDGQHTAIGVDVGAVFVKLVVLDGRGDVRAAEARRHCGNPLAVMCEEMARLRLDSPVVVGLTGGGAARFLGGVNVEAVDPVQAEVTAVRRRFSAVRNIINVGGGSVTLIRLDEAGRLLDYAANSLCAAGTGSFLDQQAERLNIGYADMERFERVEDPPTIATRCSVFAKSDLVHRQQEGYGKAALWCGLCRSMTGTFLNTLLRGRPLQGLTVVTGGVSRNAEVLRWLKARYGDQVQTYDLAPFSCAEGAARLTNGRRDTIAATVAGLRDRVPEAAEAERRPPLALRLSRYPDFRVEESLTDAIGNEVRVTRWPSAAEVSGFLGVDVGSTSTKVMLIDEDGEPLADVYRRTGGEPIRAAQRLFEALSDLYASRGVAIRVLGVGVTGSGRKLVGQVIGADVIRNEITAHLAGASRVDPAVETIFEIGGQDSKYIHAGHGRIVDSNMNYVCAAGTGSFVEEQARRLGIGLDEIGDLVMGVAPPITSERCTVFMEQDVDRLLRRGHTREECMAAVLCSVARNYLTKVVGRRPVSPRRVVFQGATARNRGLVAAFENVLGLEVAVSPYCHVMGSWGAALLARERMASTGATRFRGLDLSRRAVRLRQETCRLCSNHCRITFAEIEGEAEQPSWGYLCGRDPDDRRARKSVEFNAFDRRLDLVFGVSSAWPAASRDVAGIPRSLATYGFLPLWRGFLAGLGVQIKLSRPTHETTIQGGAELTAADFCFPVKVAHGAVQELLADAEVDWVFLPHMIQARKNPAAINSHFCPYVQAFPSVVRSALRSQGSDERILSPVVDMSGRSGPTVDSLYQALGPRLGVSRCQVAKAWKRGIREQQAFDRARTEEGRRILAEVEADGRPAIVILGRPYNTLDLGANLALPRKISQLGLRVIPMDMLPYDERRLNPCFRDVYWQYGQHILAAAEFVRDHPNLYAVCLTNFACGPDSLLLSFVDEIFGDKPYLTIELDEHGGDAGYLTRIEAFLDVLRGWKPAPRQSPFRVAASACDAEDLRRRRLWIPPMHPFATRLFAAAFRGHGYDARPMPPEDMETLERGRTCTRGSECLPLVLTTGALMRHIEEPAPNGHAFFMPCAEGPCRFGLYASFQRLALRRAGRSDVPILSPSSQNTYQGLSPRLRARLWEAVVAGDALLKCGCRLRPYEENQGDVDRVLAQAVADVESAFAAGDAAKPAIQRAIQALLRVPLRPSEPLPLVGVAGEIYVRSNPFSNANVVRAIEQAGGEAWPTPAAEWVLYAAALQERHARRAPLNIAQRLLAGLGNRFLLRLEHEYATIATPILQDRREPSMADILREGSLMLPVEFGGEAIMTVGRARLFARQGAALVVSVAPFGCMPSTISSALLREAQAQIGIPVVSMFYDGEQDANDRLAVFLNSLGVRGDAARRGASARARPLEPAQQGSCSAP